MKHKTIEDAGKRSWMFALRVFNSKDFKKDASQFRKKFNIPIAGFKDYSDAGVWFTELYYDSLDKVTANKHSTFKTAMQRFRDHGELIFDDLNSFQNYRKLKIVDAWFSFEDIRHKYAIPPRWRKGVLTVLLTNSTDNVYLSAGVSVGKKYNGNFYNEELEIRVDRFTRKRDLDEAWKVIENMQETLWGAEVRVKEVKEFKKYERAASLRKKGLTFQKIGDEFGITSSEAKNWESRYYKAIGVNSKRARYL